MDRPYVADNNTARERLRDIVSRLSERDMDRPLGQGWTVKAALAHLSYWDRWIATNIERWEREGVQVALSDADALNAAMLSQWQSMPFQDVLHEVVSAAETTDRKIETLTWSLEQEIKDKRPRALNRANHRREHLDEIERALAG